MGRFLGLALAILLTAATPSSLAAGWADALFDQQGHDFGPVPRGAIVRHPFLLTNRLQEPLTILNVRASCGCTSGRASRTQLQPGEQAVVEAQMDTRNFVGRKATVLFVDLVTASGRQAEARLPVASTILSDIVLNPGELAFGAVRRGQPQELVLTIDRVGAPGWRAERMLSSTRALDASLVETTRNAAQVQYALKVKLRNDAPAGAFRDEIRIVTNDPATPYIPVTITGQVVANLSASPSQILLGGLRAGETRQGRVLVRSPQPFAITAIEGNGDGFALTPDNAERKSLHVLTLQYKPDAPAGPSTKRTFRITTDLPGEQPLEISASAEIVR
jgi:hypothetical protein